MSNIQRGVHTIALGEKEYTFKLDLNALVAMEEQGVALSDLGNTNSNQVTAMRAIIWAGIKHGEPGLTIEEVGEKITLDNMQEVSEALTEVFKGFGKNK